MTHPVNYRRILNKMGYYAYQNGLIHNHLSQEGRWDSHLGRCRNFIIRALDYYKPQKVTVLGSGWLMDLPLAEIAEKSESVYLIDIIHPPEVIGQVRNLKNVFLMEQDISGGLIETVWNICKRRSLFKKSLSPDAIRIPAYDPGFDPGMVISLNILTQLESRLVDFIKRRSLTAGDDLNLFRAGIQRSHIDFLLKHRSVLITDRAEVITRKNGDVATVPTLLPELPAGLFSEEWTWDFDLTGAEYFRSRSTMKMISLVL
jgi:hypothetical protein